MLNLNLARDELTIDLEKAKAQDVFEDVHHLPPDTILLQHQVAEYAANLFDTPLTYRKHDLLEMLTTSAEVANYLRVLEH